MSAVILMFFAALAFSSLCFSSETSKNEIDDNYSKLTQQIKSLRNDLRKEKETNEKQRETIETLLQELKTQGETISFLLQETENEKMSDHVTHTGTEQTNFSQRSTKPRNERADDSGPIFEQLTQQLNEIKAEVQALKNAQAHLEQTTSNPGTTYIRWGHAACPAGANTVYSGFVGGSYYDNSGAAANHLCLPHNPVMTSHARPHCGPAALHAAEYDTCPESSHDLDPTCALCHIPRSSSVMIAGTNACWSGWTKEYSGYLMAGYHGNGGATEFICVDQSLGYMEGSGSSHQGNLLHYVIYYCNTLPCPPYENGKTALCAVCSK